MGQEVTREMRGAGAVTVRNDSRSNSHGGEWTVAFIVSFIVFNYGRLPREAETRRCKITGGRFANGSVDRSTIARSLINVPCPAIMKLRPTRCALLSASYAELPCLRKFRASRQARTDEYCVSGGLR